MLMNLKYAVTVENNFSFPEKLRSPQQFLGTLERVFNSPGKLNIFNIPGKCRDILNIPAGECWELFNISGNAGIST